MCAQRARERIAREETNCNARNATSTKLLAPREIQQLELRQDFGTLEPAVAREPALRAPPTARARARPPRVDWYFTRPPRRATRAPGASTGET
jgi:hypothetical protein